MWYLDFHGAGSQSCDLLLRPFSDSRVHGGAARQHAVSIQVFADVVITLLDAVVGNFVDAHRLQPCSDSDESHFLSC